MTINTYTIGQSHDPNDSWLLSNWGAGQTLNMDWQADNVTRQSDGTTVLTLDRTGTAAGRPYAGAEIQSSDADTSGTWEYIAKAPVMVDGAVFGMFLYQADWRDDWLEFDFEFVGSDTTEVQVTVHMEDPSGKHIAAGKVIDLWFDAAQEFAKYTISVDHDSAEFYVNGVQVAQFTARDMPDGQWDTGPMKSYVDLWSADSRYTDWTGTWTGNNVLTAHVWDASTPGGPALTPRPGTSTPPTSPTAPQPAPVDPANLLVNGSFEATTVATGTWSAQQTVAGWTALPGSGIELWNSHNGIQARNGSNFVELDYLGATDGIYQDVRTGAGQSYTLSFDLAARPGAALSTQGVEVLWNGQVVATVQPIASGTHGIWITPTVIVTGTGNLDRLTLREVGSQGSDGVGALLDNVRLVAGGGAQPTPTPPTGPVVLPPPEPESPPVTPTTPPSGTNLLVNGSFEASAVTTGGWAATQTMQGWTALTGGRIELWNAHGGIRATNGVNFAELDYQSGMDGFFQDVRTGAGQGYTLSLDLAARPGQTLATQSVEVLWNGQVVATLQPTASGWTTSNLTVTGTGNLDRLTLREVGSQGGDGLGALLDNVRLVAASGQTPAPTVPSPTPSTPTAIVGDDLDNVLRGTSSNDRIEGRGGNDSLVGEAGDDHLSGGDGNDVLNGATGNDRLEGGQGADTYVLAASGDTVVEALNAGMDKVRAAYSYTLGSNVENLELTGTAALTGTGNELDNVLAGNSAANLLQGMAGNDRIQGGQGNDRLLGGLGDDRLSGGEGADQLLGGAGRDALTGGAGDDIFVLNSPAEGCDAFTDFSNLWGNNDVFHISAAGFGGGLVAGGNLSGSQFQIRGDNIAQDSDDRFILRSTDKTLWFDADGRGGSAAVMIADLQADATLTSADLLLV